MCKYCDNIGYPNPRFSLDCDIIDDNWEEMQIVRSHEWNDHGYLVLGSMSWIDPIKAVSNNYSKKIKFCPFCGAWGGGEYEKC